MKHIELPKHTMSLTDNELEIMRALCFAYGSELKPRYAKIALKMFHELDRYPHDEIEDIWE